MGKQRLLIVDDEENVRNALQRWFELAGYEVELAEDGVIAVEKATESEYDAITMDLQMPRMNGTEAIKHIKKARPNVPIIILTGYHAQPQLVVESGAVKVLAKPVSLRELESAVREAIANNGAS
jgi:CheY-like chemotaxis protein